MNGDSLRDNGIDLVLSNASDWKDFAMLQLDKWLRWKKSEGCAEITMEEFKQDLIKWFPHHLPHHHNCWGAITRSAALAGMLVPTEKSVRMKNSAAHSRYAKVWRVPA